MAGITGDNLLRNVLRSAIGGLFAAGLSWQVAAAEAPQKAGEGAPDEKPIPYGEGVFWKIERDDIEEPSYLLGTLHVNDPRVLEIVEVVEPYLKKSDVVNFEIISSYRAARMDDASYYRDDERELEEFLSPEAFAKIKRICESYDMSEEEIQSLEIWAAYETLIYTEESSSKTDGNENDGPDLDTTLEIMAIEEGIPVKGLERSEEHFDIFKMLDDAQYIRAIEKEVAIMGDPELELENFIKWYQQRDTAAMNRSDYAEGDEQTRAMNEQFLYYMLEKRNLIMVNRMTRGIYKGNSFTAVGAGHLPGERGMLNILAQRGYKLTRIE